MLLGELSLPLARAFLLAQLSVCPPALEAPRAEVYFLPEKPQYVTEAPIKSLTEAMKGNPDSTIATDSKWFVEGITVSDLGSSQFNIDFNTLRDESGTTCLYVHKVYFVIRYAPTIFLAKELQGHECRAHMVKLHEERHVATDHKTINEYLPKLKMEILWYLRALGAQGPYPESQLKAEGRRINKEVMKAVDPMVNKLIDVRRQRQGSIDTIENYRQESMLCPDEKFGPEDILK